MLIRLFIKSWLIILMFATGATFAQSENAKFSVRGSCFKPFPTYDIWLSKMRQRNGWFKTWLISWRYDEERFNDAVATVECSVGVYPSYDGTMVQAFVVKPKELSGNKPLPIILYNRGGNQRFGAVTLAQLLDFIIPLSKQGYLVAATQYRGGSPYSEGQDEFGGRDVEDVLALGDLVAEMPGADGNQRFMLGVSRGAMNTFMALRDLPKGSVDSYRAVAVIGGLVDLVEMIEFRPEMERVYRALIPGYQDKKSEQLYNRSASLWPDQLPEQVAILQLHGEDDERVSVASARTFAERLEKTVTSHKLVVFDGEDHMIRGAREKVLETIDSWFKHHTKTGKGEEGPLL